MITKAKISTMNTVIHKTCILISFVIYTFLFLVVGVSFLVFYFLFSLTPLKHLIVLTVKRVWLKITLALFYVIFPMNINLAVNKTIFKKKKVIVISNHITNFDWIIVMRVLYELNLFDDCYFIMKESLAKIFFIGFCMKTFGFIFLKRKWSEDEEILKEQINAVIKKDYTIVIFPEGTFLNREAKEKLDIFLSKRQKEDIKIQPKYTLYPKSKGFNKINELTKSNLEGIIDITLVSDPYYEFPADEFTYTNVLFKEPGDLKISIVLDYYETSINEDFIFQCFEKKNSVFESLIRTKNLSLQEFRSALSEFKKSEKYVFKTIFMIPDKVYIFFILAFLLSILQKIKNFF